MKRILCYGDSNTWGYVSGSHHERFDETKRWTRLLSKYLGENFEIIEEGLSGRTLVSEDPRPGKEGKNGFAYLKPCMETHNPFDVIVFMLGTNELKNTFSNSAESIFEMAQKHFEFIQKFKFLGNEKSPKLLVSGLPIVNETTLAPHDLYKGTAIKSKKLNKLIEDYCKEKNIIYVNNNDLEVGIDGVHLSENGHKKLAIKLSSVIKEMCL